MSQPHPASPRAALARIAAAALLLACGGDAPGTGPAAQTVASVQVTGTTTVSVGKSTALAAMPRSATGVALGSVPVTWSSSSAAIATVSAAGSVTGVSTGTATITATASGVAGSATVTVTPDDTPASITLAPAGPLALPGGATATLVPTVRASDGHVVTNAPVTYASSDGNVAAVSGNVLVAARAGTAVITATSGAATATLTVNVSVGPAAELFVRNVPAGTAGIPLSPQPVVEIRDKGGNIVTSSTAPVFATIQSGGGMLTGTTTVDAVAGVATFTNLSVVGTGGTRRLAFASPSLTPAATADFVLAPSPTPLLAMDTTVVAFTVIAGRTHALNLGVKNVGGGTLAGITVDPATYDVGSASGWLLAAIAGGTTAPTTLALLVNAATLTPGAYRGTVLVKSADASNSPLAVTVAITVINGTFLTYGTATEKLRILDAASSYTPALSARDGLGTPIATGPVTYASRAATVATVTPQGVITAVGEGSTWVVASGATSADSVFVIVPVNATGPVLRSDITTTTASAGTAITVNVYLDTRSTAVGAVSIAVGYTTALSMFSNVTWTYPGGTVGASVNPGVIRVTAASATLLTGPVALLQLRLTPIRPNAAGAVTLTVTDSVAPDGSTLLPVTTSTRIPVVVP